MRTILLTLLALLALPAMADKEIPYIAVTASGYVEAVPDILSLDVTVLATGSDVGALQEEVEKTTRLVVKAASKQGVDKDDIDSSRISVQPDYSWIEGKRVYRGQQVQRSISLVLREPGNYGALLLALSALDLDRIGQPRADHSNLEALRMQAMDRALEEGLRKAKRIADTMDVDLGDVIRVEELGSSRSPAPRMMMAEAAAADAAPEIEFGKRRISASVALRFAID
ncbi:MAG: SIMPL domain-containing protein [Halieaceae bacterium]|jgi:uncharacterized protein YggE|nr:SIMPL domain-containing protein [Halieaceae bacterium]